MNYQAEIGELKNLIKTEGKTHLIFDFDETIAKLLIDWSHWHTPSGISAPVREIDPGFAHINLGHSDINTAIAKYGPKMLKKFQIFEEEYELKYFTGLKPYPELIAFLKAEGKKYTNFLYTSNVKKIIYPALLELGLENSFSKVVTFDDIDFMKPHPDGLKFILDSAIPKSKYLFVGDSPSDEGAAKAAGLDFFKIHFFHE